MHFSKTPGCALIQGSLNFRKYGNLKNAENNTKNSTKFSFSTFSWCSVSPINNDIITVTKDTNWQLINVGSIPKEVNVINKIIKIYPNKSKLNEIIWNKWKFFTAGLKESIVQYCKDISLILGKNSCEDDFLNHSNEKKYKKIKKQLFSFRGMWSNQNLFYDENFENKKLKYKIINLYSPKSSIRKGDSENKKNNFEMNKTITSSNKRKVRDFDSIRRPVSSFPKKKYDFFTLDKEQKLLFEDLKD